MRVDLVGLDPANGMGDAVGLELLRYLFAFIGG